MKSSLSISLLSSIIACVNANPAGSAGGRHLVDRAPQEEPNYYPDFPYEPWYPGDQENNEKSNYKYKLKICSSESSVNQKYIASYPGAGRADVILVDEKTESPYVHLEGSNVLVKYKQTDEEAEYGLSVRRNTNYANWEPLQVNEGRGSGGFKFGPGHELLYEDFKHGSFIACDWYHGKYQLFWKEGNRVTLPCNCYEVSVYAEPAWAQNKQRNKKEPWPPWGCTGGCKPCGGCGRWCQEQ